MTKLQTWNNWR